MRYWTYRGVHTEVGGVDLPLQPLCDLSHPPFTGHISNGTCYVFHISNFLISSILTCFECHFSVPCFGNVDDGSLFRRPAVTWLTFWRSEGEQGQNSVRNDPGGARVRASAGGFTNRVNHGKPTTGGFDQEHSMHSMANKDGSWTIKPM